MQGLILDTTQKSYQFLKPFFSHHQEEVWVVALSSDLELLAVEMLFRGTVDYCPLHPRELFRFLVLHSASYFLMAHNHPRGPSRPSEEDLKATQRIQKLGALIEIQLVDHIILGSDGFSSLMRK